MNDTQTVITRDGVTIKISRKNGSFKVHRPDGYESSFIVSEQARSIRGGKLPTRTLIIAGVHRTMGHVLTALIDIFEPSEEQHFVPILTHH